MSAWPVQWWTSVTGACLIASVLERVPQVVEDDRVVLLAQKPEPGGLERLVEPVAGHVVDQVPSDDVAEHEVVQAGEVLSPAELVERDHGLVGQRNAADAVRLRGVLLEPAGRHVAPDVHDPVGEADVPPPEREQLALT